MGFLDRLFGAQDEVPSAPPRRAVPNDDERAVERYRYLLRTAPPETIEQVHAEAFSRLSESQRAQVYEELSKGAGTGERPLSSEPATLARAATRKEMRDPGSLERTLTGPSFGSMVGSTLLGTVAGYVIGSALVSAFLPWDAGYDANANADSGSDTSGSDASADAGGDSSGDFGGGDFGGDFGGGDFGF
jgi:hypothetical protein